MKFATGHKGQESAMVQLFEDTFTASAGAGEGRLIGTLVADLMAHGTANELFAFSARDAGGLVGAIFLSRMRFGQSGVEAFLLSPVAVRKGRQGEGIGQGLIAFGLDRLRREGVRVVLTYGDPAFYSRVGFRKISTDLVPAPHPLSQPGGWLGQSLTGAPLVPLPGPARTVAAMDRPEIW